MERSVLTRALPPAGTTVSSALWEGMGEEWRGKGEGEGGLRF